MALVPRITVDMERAEWVRGRGGGRGEGRVIPMALVPRITVDMERTEWVRGRGRRGRRGGGG